MDAPSLFPWILLIAITGVSMAVYRLKAGQDKEREGKQWKEMLQNRLFESGKELEAVSALLSENRIFDACKLFYDLYIKIGRFKHTDFGTIDWKNYFEQVQNSRDEMWAYISTNHPEECQRVFLEKQAVNKKNAKNAKKNDTTVQFIVLAVIFGGVGLVGMLILFCQKN
jgi:hypothetical protein